MRFLKPVVLSERCFLYEVLLWVAFQRPPVATYSDIEDIELRDAEGDLEQYGYAANHPRIFWILTDQECAEAGLPPHPEMRWFRDATWDEDWEEQAMQHWTPKYESIGTVLNGSADSRK